MARLTSTSPSGPVGTGQDVEIVFVSDLPDPEAFEALLLDYYGHIERMILDAGGPHLTAAGMTADSLAHLSDMLPPNGRLALACAPDGRLLGCGALRFIPGGAEMKRMFVRPEAQGRGLGRKLFEMRISEARRMGRPALYADTVKGNRPMLSLYESYGFAYIPRYEGNGNPVELDPYLVYLEYRFPEAG